MKAAADYHFWISFYLYINKAGKLRGGLGPAKWVYHIIMQPAIYQVLLLCALWYW